MDYVLAGIGTGGTASGITLSFKNGSDAKVIGVEPVENPLITDVHAGPHRIQGLGANFVPGNYHEDAVDGMIAIPGDDTIAMSVRLAREEDIFAGISSGPTSWPLSTKCARSPRRGS